MNREEIKLRISKLATLTNDKGCKLVVCAKSSGYGILRISGKNYYIHRLILIFKHNLPDNAKFTSLHSCDTKSCINEDHLSIGSTRENSIQAVIRGLNKQTNKTHCPQGHEYTKENTYKHRNRRHCNICRRKNALDRYYGR